MAKGYRAVRRDQPFLLPPDMREWLPADHPVWLVISVVADHLDTSAAHRVRRAGGRGAAGFDPDMLVTLLIWAYANGVTSSRRVEAACRTDIAFRVICGGDVPDHVTVARFRAALPDLAAELFAEVLVLCARLGMGQLGVVALDGTKIAASASKDANRTEEGLRKLAAEAVAAHGEADAAEDALSGQGRRGDEVPPDAWRPGRRDERIAAALAGLEAEREAAQRAEQGKAQEFRARREAGKRTGPAPLTAAAELAQEQLERARAARVAQLAALEERYAAGEPRRRRREAGVEDYCRVREAKARARKAKARAERARRREKDRKGPGQARNITDPDSRLMPVRGGGFIQGYNAQNMTSSDGLIIATALTQDTTDAPWFKPMLRAAEDAAAVITGARRPAGGPGQDGSGPGPRSGIGLLLADAGYCSEASLTLTGPDRLIAVAKHRDLEKSARGQQQPAPQPRGPATAAMRQRLQTQDGITAYRHRGHIAETPHGNIKHNKRFRQLTMRGKRKAAAEWTFAATVHNLSKAISAGHLTSHALAALAA